MTPLQTFLAKYNVVDEIQFTSNDHRYFDPTRPNVKYTSCTTVIGEYEEEYDSDLWSMQTALKEKGYKVRVDVPAKVLYINGVKNHLDSLKKNTLFKAWQDVVLAKWNTITIEACERGNENHDFLENSINQSKGFGWGGGNDNHLITSSKIKHNLTSMHDLDRTQLKEVYPTIYNRFKAYLDAGCSIFAEKRVRLDAVQIAGMIDSPIFKGNSFAILDWKTNKDELKTKPGYYKKEWIGGKLTKTDKFIETNDTFTGVLSHLPFCKFNVYALQLSIYAYILECWGYTLVPNGLEIMHIRPNQVPKLIKIPYLIDEVELIMKDRLRKLGIVYEGDSVNAPFNRSIKFN